MTSGCSNNAVFAVLIAYTFTYGWKGGRNANVLYNFIPPAVYQSLHSLIQSAAVSATVCCEAISYELLIVDCGGT